MTQRQSIDEGWLTASQAAAITDPPISVSTLIRWEREGKVTAIRTLGGHRRFKRSDIEALMQSAGQAASA